MSYGLNRSTPPLSREPLDEIELHERESQATLLAGASDPDRCQTPSDSISGEHNRVQESNTLAPQPASSLYPTSRVSYHVFRYWMWELCALVAAIGLLVSIFFILVCYNDRPLSDVDRDLRIGLNSLLALLGTLFRTLILVPTTSIISQSKWDWVGRGHFRPLGDIQLIDAARRGLGAHARSAWCRPPRSASIANTANSAM